VPRIIDADREKALLNALVEMSPRNLAAVARSLGMPEETVRYKLRRYYERGLVFYAFPDLSRVGLRPYYTELKFSGRWRPSAGQLLQSMSMYSYISYYTGYLTGSWLTAYFSMPYGTGSHLRRLLDEMADMGIIEGYRLRPASWVSYRGVDPEFFDPEAGEWDVDWTSVRPLEELPDRVDYPEESPRAEFDYYDLAILAELQQDARVPVAEIAERTGVNEKTLAYHFNRHVVENGIVRRYMLKWWGGPYAKTNTVTYLELVVSGIRRRDVEELRRRVEALPFAYSSRLLEDGELVYILQAMMPPNYFNQSMIWMRDRLSELGALDAASFRLLDARESASMTVPLELYNREGESWTMKVDELIEKLRAVRAMVEGAPSAPPGSGAAEDKERGPSIAGR
jgi:DNA-binding Lrp family transcriptional regulator